MYSAPSVSYPVGRCAFQAWLYSGFVGFTSAVLVAWALQQGLSPVGWLAVSAAVLAAYLGWQSMRESATLTWDGQVWCLHDQSSGQVDALGEVHVVLDVQKALLLRWLPASDTLKFKPQWLWLGSHGSGHRWQDLRRAVYQRHSL